MKQRLLCLVLLIGLTVIGNSMYGQPRYQFTVYISNYVSPPEVISIGDTVLQINFEDTGITSLLSGYTITRFEQSCPTCRRATLRNLWDIETNDSSLLLTMLNYDSTVFVYGYQAPGVDAISCYPPDFGMETSQVELELIRAPEAWCITKGSKDVVVGVLDTYFDLDHPELELNNNIVQVRGNKLPNDQKNHGTAVAGIIGGLTHNNIGLASVGYGISLDLTNDITKEPDIIVTTGAILPKAIMDMSNDGRRIVNNSWGYRKPYCEGSIDFDNQYAIMTTFHDGIYEGGTFSVWGAGNGIDNMGANRSWCDYGPVYPSSYNHNFSVTSVSHTPTDVHQKNPGTLDGTHNHNEKVDLCAPGYDIGVLLSGSVNGGTYYGRTDGSSFAAPMVSGAVALMLSVNPHLSPYQMEYVLKQSSDNSIYSKPENTAYIGKLGAGRLDVEAAVTMAKSGHSDNSINVNDPALQTMYVSVDIDSRCAPLKASNSKKPQFTVKVKNGMPPFSYKWYSLPENYTTLDQMNIANPTILTSTDPPSGTYGNVGHVAHYYVIVKDNSPIQKVASQEVKVRLSTDKLSYDLAMRDSEMDMLNEHNTQTDIDPHEWNIWLSPDVWNQQHNLSAASHQDPLYGTTNYVYTRVRNVGCAPSPSDAELKLYWSLASTGEKWPDDWTTTDVGNCAGGREITILNPIVLPVLEPGDQTIVYRSWGPPDPQCIDNRTRKVDVCFLARIEEPGIVRNGMYKDEVQRVKDNVLNNNNVVTRNMSLAANRAEEGGRVIMMRNVDDSAQVFNLELIPEKLIRKHFAGDLSAFVGVTVQLGDLYPLWLSGGRQGTVTSYNDVQRTVYWDPSVSVRMENVQLDTGVHYPVYMSFHPKHNALLPDTVVEQLFHFRQFLDTGGGELLYGNVTFLMRYEPDSVVLPGVLFLRQVSNGPAGTRCESVELIVANCGDDQSDYVDIRGWILDDNSGNFSIAGCADSMGIMPGHYRLSDSSIWGKVPVGSSIILYNINDNCYNLPDTFKVTPTSYALADNYWVPVGYGGTNLIEKYDGLPGVGDCMYCDTTIANVYTVADAWGCTVGLYDQRDGFQVRCPGCSPEYSGEPKFYHGFGYGKTGFASIPIDTGVNLGGPVLSDSGRGNTFLFTGNTSLNLGDAAYWTSVPSLAGGTPPGYLGSDTSGIRLAAVNHMLNLPCCPGPFPPLPLRKAPPQQEEEPIPDLLHKPEGPGIRVYPNPAGDVLYIDIPVSNDVTIIRLMDLSGRVAQERRVTNQSRIVLDVRGYVPGMYVYQLVTNDKVYSGKITIQSK